MIQGIKMINTLVSFSKCTRCKSYALTMLKKIHRENRRKSFFKREKNIDIIMKTVIVELDQNCAFPNPVSLSDMSLTAPYLHGWKV